MSTRDQLLNQVQKDIMRDRVLILSGSNIASARINTTNWITNNFKLKKWAYAVQFSMARGISPVEYQIKVQAKKYMVVQGRNLDFFDADIEPKLLDIFGAIYDAQAAFTGETIVAMKGSDVENINSLLDSVDKRFRFLMWLASKLPLLIIVDESSTRHIIPPESQRLVQPFEIYANVAISEFATNSEYKTVKFKYEDTEIENSSNLLFFTFTNKDYSSKLAAYAATIEVPMPDGGDRYSIINRAMKNYGKAHDITVRLAKGSSEDNLKSATAALTERDIYRAVFKGLDSAKPKNNGKVKELVVDVINELKRKIIQESGVLELIEGTRTLDDIAGQLGVKRYMQEEFFATFKYPELRYLRPQGILFMGEAGLGKSLLAECIGNEVNVPVVIIKLSNIMSSYVGESEQNMARMLELLKSFGDVIAFIDEIDQAFGSRSSGGEGDSGVNRRILQQFMEAIGTSAIRGQITVIGATNTPKVLDSAWLDRFQVRLAFLAPDEEDLYDMYKINFRMDKIHETNFGDEQPSEEVLRYLAKQSVGYLGRTTVQIATDVVRHQAIRNAKAGKDSPITMKTTVFVMDNLGSAATRNMEFQRQALDFANPLYVLPEKIANARREAVKRERANLVDSTETSASKEMKLIDVEDEDELGSDLL